MRPQQFCILGIFAVLALVQGVFGYCNKKLGYCFTVDPVESPINDGKSYVKFTLEAPIKAGWAGVGVGQFMTDSYLMIAWPNTDGTVTVSQRRAQSYYEPEPTSNQDDLMLVSEASGIKNDKFVAVILRAASVNGSSIQSQEKQWFIYAVGPARPEKAYNSSLQGHLPDHMGATELTVGDKDSGSNKFLTLHAVFMFIAWAVTTPIAIFVVRFGKRTFHNSWFRIHWITQVVMTTAFIILGFIFAVLALGGLRHANVHHILGYIIISAFVVQIGLGVFHHAMYDKRREYVPLWTKIHWWFGRLLFVTVLVQIQLGFRLFSEASNAWSIAYNVYIGVLIAIFIGLSFYQRRSWRQKDETSGYEFDDTRKFVKMNETST